MQATVTTSAVPRRLVRAVVVALVVGFVLGAAIALSRTDSRREDRVALDDIAVGVSMARVGDRAVVLVRDGDDVTAFVPSAGRADRLVWSAEDGVLATALTASHYSLDGARVAGPGPARLAEYPVRVSGDDLVVGTSHAFDVTPVPWSRTVHAQFTDAAAGVC